MVVFVLACSMPDCTNPLLHQPLTEDKLLAAAWQQIVTELQCDSGGDCGSSSSGAGGGGGSQGLLHVVDKRCGLVLFNATDWATVSAYLPLCLPQHKTVVVCLAW